MKAISWQFPGSESGWDFLIFSVFCFSSKISFRFPWLPILRCECWGHDAWNPCRPRRGSPHLDFENRTTWMTGPENERCIEYQVSIDFPNNCVLFLCFKLLSSFVSNLILRALCILCVLCALNHWSGNFKVLTTSEAAEPDRQTCKLTRGNAGEKSCARCDWYDRTWC